GALGHRAGRGARTRMAAAVWGPLDVLAYAGGSPTGLTVLPRAGVSWVGSRWLPQDAPHPFAAEPPAEDLPAAAPRPPTIVALDELEPKLQDRGPVHRTRRDIGRGAGSQDRKSGV